MAVDLKANVSKATIWDANYISRSAALHHEGHVRVVGTVQKLCECKEDGFRGKGWHFNSKYEDGDEGCATLASVRENLVALDVSSAPATPGPVVAKRWKSHEIKKLKWLLQLDTQVKIGDGIYVGTPDKLCNCKRREMHKNGWHFHMKYADGDQGCACAEDVRHGVIDTTKIPQKNNPSTPVATPVVVVESLASFKMSQSGQDSAEKKLPEYEKPVKVAVQDGRMKSTKKVDTPKKRSRCKKSATKIFCSAA
jgi:hypothetical protein